MTVRTPLLAAALFAASVPLAPPAYADTPHACDVIDRYTGVWQWVDDANRPAGQIVIGRCDRSERASPPSFLMESWGTTTSGSLHVADLTAPNGKYSLVVDVMHRNFLYGRVLWLMEHVRVENDRLCYPQSRTGSQQGNADVVWVRTDEGACYSKVTTRLDRSRLYASPEEKAAAAAKAAQEQREQCSKDCASTQSECKREWGSHPMCDSNFYACDQRCAAAP